MKRILVSKLHSQIGSEVTVQGWVQAIRDQKHVTFIIVRDHTGSVQVVVERSGPVLLESTTGITRESAVTVVGRLVENPGVGLGGIEIHPKEIRVENLARSPLPLDPCATPLPGLDLRIDSRHLDLRRPSNRLFWDVQTTLLRAMREF